MPRELKLAIVGGGFGLYGYLPAVIESVPDAQIAMNARHRERLIQREDVKIHEQRVMWTEEDALLKDCNAVIIAVPPKEQEEWVKRCLATPSVTHVLLEKPVAATPAASIDLHNALIRSGKTFRVGYNFRFTDWGQALLAESKGVEDIVWRFKAHHFTNDLSNWKKDHAMGGGALRFYGIHVIALLSELGYKNVILSTLSGDASRWTAEFAGGNLPVCRVSVDSNDENATFSVNGARRSLFEETSTPNDARVPYLKLLLTDWLGGGALYKDWYGKTLDLWRLVEDKTS